MYLGGGGDYNKVGEQQKVGAAGGSLQAQDKESAPPQKTFETQKSSKTNIHLNSGIQASVTQIDIKRPTKKPAVDTDT